MEKKKKEPLVQTGFWIEATVLKEIKERALFLNISMKKWILQAVLEKIKRENYSR